MRSPWVLGLDGCKAGWVGVFLDVTGTAPPRLELFSSLAEALDAPERPEIITIDMPIGFEDAPSGPGRACEREARQRLKPGRTSSVFSSPLRPTLAARSYEEARRLNRAAGGPGLSAQSYGLFAKLREIDALVTPAMESRLFETHPEVGFAVLNGAPMAYPKKTLQGRAERLALLARHGMGPAPLDPHSFPKTRCAPDDVVDAAMCALSALRIVKGEAVSLPANPPRDGRGLLMRIVI